MKGGKRKLKEERIGKHRRERGKKETEGGKEREGGRGERKGKGRPPYLPTPVIASSTRFIILLRLLNHPPRAFFSSLCLFLAL